MQSDPPKGDPRLQPTNPGHTILAVRPRHNPCAVNLEATLADEVPLLGVCWATNSQEIRPVGRPAYVALQTVSIFQNQPNHRNLWTFTHERASSVYLIHTPSHTQHAKLSYSPSDYKDAPDPVFRWAIRHFEIETFFDLKKIWEHTTTDPRPMVTALFREANLDWQSMEDALAYLEKSETRTKPARRRSLVSQALSSLFTQKPHPTPA